MSQNPDSVVNQGEFAGHVAGTEPIMSGGHKPGVKVGNDTAPEFSAKVLPAGSAPKDSTYQPNPDLNNQKMFQDASSTIQGATSADVHKGLGHPGSGQVASDKDRKHRQGLAGLSNNVPDTDVGGKTESLKDDPKYAAQRNLGDVPTGQRGNTGGPPAEEREPEKAENI